MISDVAIVQLGTIGTTLVTTIGTIATVIIQSRQTRTKVERKTDEIHERLDAAGVRRSGESKAVTDAYLDSLPHETPLNNVAIRDRHD